MITATVKEDAEKLRRSVLRFTDNTIDLFGDGRTHEQRKQAIEMQERSKQRRGGPVDTSWLPLFEQNQTDLFIK